MTGTNLSSFVDSPDSPVPRVVSKFSTVNLSLEEDATQFEYNEDVIGSHFRPESSRARRKTVHLHALGPQNGFCSSMQEKKLYVGPSDRCPAYCIWSDSRA